MIRGMIMASRALQHLVLTMGLYMTHVLVAVWELHRLGW